MEKILNSSNEIIAYHDRVKDFQFRDGSEIKLWLIIDFDDVVNQTTTFSNYLRNLLCNDVGLSKEDFDVLYKESKLLNKESGKKIFRLNYFVKEIKERFPDEADFIEKFFENIDYNKFIDQAVKKVLLSIRALDNHNVRITLLTYGDIDYQKRRINNTSIRDIYDDIVYTENSKKEVIESLSNKFFQGVENVFTIIIDDNLEHIDDCKNLSMGENYLVIQFHNPRSKRYFEKTSLKKKFLISEEVLHNQAALNIYNIFKIDREQNIKKYRQEIINLLNNPLDYNDLDSKIEKDIRKTK